MVRSAAGKRHVVTTYGGDGGDWGEGDWDGDGWDGDDWDGDDGGASRARLARTPLVQ